MAIPSQLQMLIDEGVKNIDENPDHDLNLGIREAIYWTLGPYRLDLETTNNSGYLRRISLAKQALLFVLPIWEAEWPEDKIVSQIIARIEEVSTKPLNEIDRDIVDQEISDYWEYVVELTDTTRKIAGVVGMAAVAAFSLALWDGFTEHEDIDWQRTDSDDFMVNETHFYAATAYANGPPYPIALASNSSATKRREFWLWWLTSAVPTAWEVV